ncbi:MAG: T9SS type A sorting domain-containing protein [Bacteroidetes bacterium]|nr:T9SS type A sorting domain-containing protein [Bacteroidota bacterium]
MKKLYALALLFFFTAIYNFLQAQNCALLHATSIVYESRCAATGAIKILVTGGSGSYKYKASGPVNTNFTSTDSITGLSAGAYSIVVMDVVSNCSITIPVVVVPGSYVDPRFTLQKTDVTCDHGSNGTITTAGLLNGRAPFIYSIVAPSPMGVGTQNSTGIFTGLSAGTYSIRLTDSCGGIQTRNITINDYSWYIDNYNFNKYSCDSANGFIKVVDSKGNVSTGGGIPGFEYAAISVTGDTTWSSSPYFQIGANGIHSVDILVKDACGNIKKVTVPISLIPNVGALVVLSNKTCLDFTASISGVVNFFSPEYCLYDSNDVLITCDSTGVFNNLAYGNYCIKAHDACTDTIITRCFNAQPPPISLDDNVLITNKTCNTFDVKVTGQTGVTSPLYILLNGSYVYVNSNGTGIFTGLPYGDYCILMKDGCRDTTITRCFSVKRPEPRVDSVIIPSYINCVNFGLLLGGDSLTFPTYCLYDSNGVVIECNNTGKFDSVLLGSYCVSIHDACTDTTIRRCFTVKAPTVNNDIVVSILNKTCNTFTASASSETFVNALFCLYDSADVLITCDSSGIFNNLAYGSYCIKTRNGCPDTTVVSCFTASPPVPSVSATATISNKSCTSFSAKIAGQTNLTNPVYCLLNFLGDTLTCNTTGVFNNLIYGSYCIVVRNTCYDTTFKVCLNASRTPFSISAAAQKSCNYGKTKLKITLAGIFPVHIQVYDTANVLVSDTTFNSSPGYIDNLNDMGAGYYKVVGTDNCGKRDSATALSVIGYLNHSVNLVNKCPGGSSANGSADLQATAISNMGTLTVNIISKDGVLYSPALTPDNITGSLYTFNDRAPGVYIFSYKANDGCNVVLYDTVTVFPYQYPNLSRSSAYQCDVNGFSVGAVVTNGVGPFTYEIIGSTPSTPSIIAGPQSSPIFNINNGFNYSLIRLRALDACGNATLGDASILPLALNGIKVSLNCFEHPALLTVDSIFNSTYSWYRKKSLNATDSTFLGNGYSYFVPSVQVSDTAWYVCHLSVNSGCISRTYYFHLTGDCFPVLPVMLVEFTGQVFSNENELSWTITNTEELSKIILERKSGNQFNAIASFNTRPEKNETYKYLDKNYVDQSLYRLKLVRNNQTILYSNIVFLKRNSPSMVSIYPNPVDEEINVDFNKPNDHLYKITLLNVTNQVIAQYQFKNSTGANFKIHRTKNMTAGFYLLRFEDQYTSELFTQKIIFNGK